jgi:LuxR family transcriptional regulator, maltose regulon positive regulatory protein
VSNHGRIVRKTGLGLHPPFGGSLHARSGAAITQDQASTNDARSYNRGGVSHAYARGMRSTDDFHPFIVLDRELTVVHCPVADSNFSGSLNATSWQVRRAFVRARRALLHMRLRDVSRYLLQIKNLLAADDAELRERYEGALAELRVCALVAQDDLPRAQELLRVMSPVDSAGTLLPTLGRYIDWANGMRAEPSSWRLAPDPVPRAHRRVLERVLGLCLNASSEFEHLRPTMAANFAAEALRLATARYGADSPVSCLPAVLLGQIAYEQGRLSEADSLLRPRVTLIRATGMLECILRAFTVLARLSLHQGRSGEALACLRDAEAIGRTRGWPRLVSAARAEHARILLVATHTATMDMHATHRLGGSSVVGAVKLGEIGTLSYSSIQSLLARIGSASTLQGANPSRILLNCLRVGAARGLYRLFIDAGAPVIRLLQTLHDDPERLGAHAKALHGYIGLLLRGAAPAPARTETSPSRRHAPLSRREKAILRMIADGMSNKRIAQSLGIAPETVKSHAKSIFLKLGTRTRAQAVAHVASLDLT